MNGAPICHECREPLDKSPKVGRWNSCFQTHQVYQESSALIRVARELAETLKSDFCLSDLRPEERDLVDAVEALTNGGSDGSN